VTLKIGRFRPSRQTKRGWTKENVIVLVQLEIIINQQEQLQIYRSVAK